MKIKQQMTPEELALQKHKEHEPVQQLRDRLDSILEKNVPSVAAKEEFTAFLDLLEEAAEQYGFTQGYRMAQRAAEHKREVEPK